MHFLTPGILFYMIVIIINLSAMVASVMSGATPIYLEIARNPFGSIGGILDHCFDESYIRQLVAEKSPEKANAKRPI